MEVVVGVEMVEGVVVVGEVVVSRDVVSGAVGRKWTESRRNGGQYQRKGMGSLREWSVVVKHRR